MSFALTTEQIRARTKTVTRRLGWTFLKPGDLVRAVVKAQGLKKGEKQQQLATLRIVDVDREPLKALLSSDAYGWYECKFEGFPGMRPIDFVAFFCKSHRCEPEDDVTRIEFEYA